jgi:hypothetical protein
VNALGRFAGRGLAVCVLAQFLVGFAAYLPALTAAFAVLLLLSLMNR